MTRSLLLAALLFAGGCASGYAYVPTSNATATVRGRIAADYPIPPNAPRGDVRIASYGVVDVSPRSAPREKLRALHLRVVLANGGASPWTFDTRAQRVDLGGYGPLVATFASANAGSAPPLVMVDPDGKRVVDLFFLLPPNMQQSKAIPEFDALWTVDTGSGPVAERTPFERLLVEPEYGYYADWDYGPYDYWAGPYWVNPAFPFDGYPYGYVGGGIVIHRPPHFGHGGVRGNVAHAGSHGGGRGPVNR